jgi:hypothetical protein
MNWIKHPVIVMPPVYELSLGIWQWCNLIEVCAVVPDLALLARIGIEFKPTPEELVSRFAALVRPNRLPWPASAETEDVLKKKLFRYSLAGNGISGREVPMEGSGKAPPYVPFNLNLGTPYPDDMFVPEGWVIDTLKAIRRGAIAAADFGDIRIGFPPRDSKKTLFIIEGKPGTMLVKMPELV